MEVRVLTGDLESFIPHQTMDAKLGCEMELDKVSLSSFVDQSIGVHTETLHHAE